MLTLSEGIVFTGVSGCFAGAPTPRDFWKATLRKRSFFAPPSEEDEARLDAPLLPDCAMPPVCAALGENFACRADHVPLEPDLGIGDNTDAWFAAQLLHDALADAGLAPTAAEGRSDRLALFVGYDPTFNPASVNWLWHANAVEQIVGTVQRFMPRATFGQVAALRQELLDTLPRLKPRQIALSRAGDVARWLAQNFGAKLHDRIRQGVRASLIQTETLNALMCVLILLCRSLVVPLFVDQPTAEIIRYSNGYLLTVAPFYLLLGLLQIYRSAIQSMGNAAAPFAACIIELIMRIGGTFGLSLLLGYTGICFATPLAWIGAISLLIPVYYHMLRRLCPVR